MEEDSGKQKPSSHLVRNLVVALIVVITFAIALLIGYSVTVDPLHTVLGYVAVVLLPIMVILLYALAIAVIHKRHPSSS